MIEHENRQIKKYFESKRGLDGDESDCAGNLEKQEN